MYFGDRVWALGLVGTASECNDKTAAWYDKCIAVGLEKGGEAVMKAMGMRADPERAPDGQGVAPVLAAMRTLNPDPLTERMKGLDLPTFIIVGDKGPVDLVGHGLLQAHLTAIMPGIGDNRVGVRLRI